MFPKEYFFVIFVRYIHRIIVQAKRPRAEVSYMCSYSVGVGGSWSKSNFLLVDVWLMESYKWHVLVSMAMLIRPA